MRCGVTPRDYYKQPPTPNFQRPLGVGSWSWQYYDCPKLPLPEDPEVPRSPPNELGLPLGVLPVFPPHELPLVVPL